MIYEHEGDEARAALATAERSNLEGNAKMAYASAEMALKGITPNTPDYLRAQDIPMVSRAELAKKDKKYRDPKALRREQRQHRACQASHVWRRRGGRRFRCS